MYSARLLDHFEHPRLAGELPDANARVRIENPACGDILELAAHVENGVVRAIRFRAKGCVPSMACGSALVTLTNGKPVTMLRALRKEDILAAVDGVPAASQHAVHLALDAAGQLWKVATKSATSTTEPCSNP